MQKKAFGLLTLIIIIGAIFQVSTAFAQTVDERLKRVNDELIKGDYDSAINDTNEVLKVEANNALAFEYRGLAHLGKQELPLAIADYTQAITLNPNPASFYYNRGVAIEFQQNPDHQAAFDDFTKAIKINPKNKDYYLERGYPDLMKEYWDLANSDYTQAISLGENSAKVYINRGVALLNLQYYSEAVADNRQALALDPNNATAKKNLEVALGLRKQSLQQKAIDKVIADGLPPSASTNESAETAQKFSRIIELIKSEDYKTAEALLADLNKQEPNNAKVFYYQAINLYEQGYLYTAFESATQAIKLNPNVAEFYHLRGLTRRYDPYIWQVEQIDVASKDFDKAIELNPNYGAPYGQKALMLYYFSLDNSYSALNAAEDAVKVDPKDGESYFIIGLVDVFRTKYKDALEVLNQAVSSGMNNAEVYENRGYVNFETNNRAQAIADYQKSLELNPNNPVAKKDLELLLAKSKYTLYPPNPSVANSYSAKMQDLFKKYNGEVSAANYSASVGGANQQEICKNLSNWVTAIHNSNNYAVELWSLARSPTDKKTFLKAYDDGTALEKTAQSKLNAQNCVF